MGSQVSKGFLAFCSAVLTINGLLWSFAPQSNMDMLGISASADPIGRNMLKSDIGAPLAAMGIMLALYLRGEKEQYGKPICLVSGSIGVVRLVSLLVDGYAPMAVYGVIVEFLLPYVILTDMKKSGSKSD